MSEHGHDILEAYYTDELKMRIGNTWASMMRCQDGDDYDCTATEYNIPSDHPYLRTMDKYIKDKNAKILEIGAGDGSETRMLMDYGYKDITGITIGNKNVSRGKELYNVDLLYMDMHFMDFPNNTFDAIVGFQTYEHTPCPLLLGLEFLRVLKPNGRMIMEVPVGQQHFPMDNNPHHLYSTDPWQGEMMLMRCGFQNVTTETYDRGANELRHIFFAQKVGNGNHNNHFNDIVNGKFLTKE